MKIFTDIKECCLFIMNFEGELRIIGNKIFNGKYQVAEFHIKNNYERNIFK